nr:DNA translocase FtsK 4TM domain-containing protein [candidate division Zixibacteria bacterium]
MARRSKKETTNGKKRKILGILLILLSVLILTSLVTHSGWDDRRITDFDNPWEIDYQNQVGIIGALSSYLFFIFFGWLSIFIPPFLVMLAFRLLDFGWRARIKPALIFVTAACALITMIANVYIITEVDYTAGYTGVNGGCLFYYLTVLIVKIFGRIGSILIMGAAIMAGLVIMGFAYPGLRARLKLPTLMTPSGIVHLTWAGIRKVPGGLLSIFRFKLPEKSPGADYTTDDNIGDELVDPDMSEIEEEIELSGDVGTATGKRKQERTGKKDSARRLKLKTPTVPVGRETKDYVFPGLDLLSDNPVNGPSVSPDELAFTARSLKDTLETFHVSIQGNIEKYPGPVITRFEFKPAAGIKVNQIVNLSDDLALALQAKRVRIVAPIPGKAAVGIEIPNRKARMVYLKEIIASEIYSDKRVQLPLALGKTISGRPFVTDLARMPHLLIAGATGSGKSVCINALITSLIYRLHPRELKFIFIDPKMLELSVYAGIPHLGRPVVTNAKRAEKVLSDAVVEMENRYKKLAAVAVRNITDFNARQKNPEERIPYIVIIVDELADMMMAASSSRIEMLITRLAQMARAVGIHLVLATQRPSVDVITGLIKANFSARIGFQVATKVDSRTILDGNGAEKLLGNGDMLFLQTGQPEPIRLHGAYISSEETAGLVKFITDQFPKVEKTEGRAEPDDDDEMQDVDMSDPVFIEAAQTVIRHKQGSVSLLQRKLGIGYQRAARLIDQLEEAGVVSKYDGSKAREVLVDSSYLEKLMSSRSLTDSNS